MTKQDYELLAMALNRGLYYGTQGVGASEESTPFPDTFEGGFDAAVSAIVKALAGQRDQFSMPKFMVAVYKDSDKEIVE